MISTRQLARMRQQVEDRLPDTCVIQTHTGAKDSAGRPTQTWAAVTGGTVACRVDRMTSRQDMSFVDAAREQTEIRYQLTVPYDAPLEANCRVIHDGKTYEILQLDIDHSWNVSKKAFMVCRQ